MSFSQYRRFARALLVMDRPVYVHFAVTDRCNLRCRACSIWRKNNNQKELGLAEIEKLARMLKKLGTVQVSLGGGEPALRDDLGQIIRAFNNADIKTRVLTNGIELTPDVADGLLDAGRWDLSISLDSLDPAYQERLDGAKGTYEKRIENLVYLAQKLPKKGVVPIINTMVTSGNLNQLEPILEIAKRIGFYVSYIPIHLADEGEKEHQFFGDDQSLAITPDLENELRDVIRRLLAAKKKGEPVINSSRFLEQIPDYLLGKQVKWPCVAGELYLSVGPDGFVSPCHKFEGNWGAPWEKFAKQFRMRQYQQKLRVLVNECEGCFRPCWAEVGLMLTDRRSLFEMMRTQWKARHNRPDFNGDTFKAELLNAGGGKI